MIPAEFEYVRPGSVDEAVSALHEAGEDAKVIGGGQSLVPMLRLRLAVPTVLVDLGRIDAVRGVRDDGDAIVIGAMTTHHDVIADALVRQHAPLIAQATETVGDRQVRNLGTFGGSLAHADPAGDLPAVAVALDAEMVVAGPSGRRTVPAGEFFVDYLTTVLEPDELLTEVRVPKLDGWGMHYEKFHHMAQSWAIVGVAAAVRRSNGSIAEARVGLTNVASVPVRGHAVESALAGGEASAGVVAEAAEQAGEGTSPSTDLNGSAEYRQHLARVLTRRAVSAAAGL
ncbi:MAG TPA: xanthine dehydrogenase family protein subunit M [Streptosporangiales bacterium]